jgi:hypothetical protein
MDKPFDYGTDSVSPAIGDNVRKALREAADKQEALEVEIAELTSKLEAKNAELRELSWTTIPNIMDGMLGAFQLGDGRTLEVKEKIRASIAGEKAAPAVAWLDEHGYSGLVKRQFVIEFNKEDDAWAKKFEADLRKRKKALNVVRKQTVHPQTLEAFVREQLGNGIELPISTFGIYRQRVSSVVHEGVVDTGKKKSKPKAEKADF